MTKFPEFNKARLVLLIALLFTTLGAGVFRTPPILFMAAVLCGAPIIGSIVGRMAARCLHMTRTLPDVGTVGDVVRGRFTVTNRSRCPLFMVHGRGGEVPVRGGYSVLEPVEDELEADFVVPLLMPGAAVTWEQDWRLTRRGRHPIGPGAAGALDPLGLHTRLDARTTKHELLVLPRPVKIGRLGWSGGVSGSARTTVEAAKVVEALDFHGVRPHHPGEGLRRIHWKSTARTGNLHIIEWEEELSADLTLLLDTQASVAVKASGQQFGTDARDTFETGITLAASVATYLLENGYQFQMLCWEGSDGTSLGRHEARNLGGLSSILAALAGLEPVTSLDATLARLCHQGKHLIPQGRGVLLITTDLADVGAALHEVSASRPQALVLDALSFASKGAPTAQRPGQRLPSNVRLLRHGESLAQALEKGTA